MISNNEREPQRTKSYIKDKHCYGPYESERDYIRKSLWQLIT